MYFEYDAKETDYLKARDSILGQAIDLIGPLQRKVNPNIFEALVDTIVAQQISSKAAFSVFSRLKVFLTDITPQNILEANADELRSCGLSARKVEYIKNAASAITEGIIDLNTLYNKSDEEIIKELVSLRGVGLWTAEMLLIFSLNRKDVLSYGDLAIRKGIKTLYKLESLSPADFEIYRVKYSPYGSVASLYLWEVGDEKNGYTSRTYC